MQILKGKRLAHYWIPLPGLPSLNDPRSPRGVVAKAIMDELRKSHQKVAYAIADEVQSIGQLVWDKPSIEVDFGPSINVNLRETLQWSEKRKLLDNFRHELQNVGLWQRPGKSGAT